MGGVPEWISMNTILVPIPVTKHQLC